MRRVALGLAVRGARALGVGAIAALACAQAFAQPATRPSDLRPAFEDQAEDDAPRRPRPARPERRREPPPAGALPTFGNPEATQLPGFGATPGAGAGTTGFMSSNLRRRVGTRRDTRKPATGATVPAPLSLTAPGTSPTSKLLRSTASGTSARPDTGTTTKSTTGAATSPSATTAAAPGAPTPIVPPVARNPLIRIPDGTSTTDVVGTVATSHLSTAQATLLRRRTALDEDPYAQLGTRAGAFLLLPALDISGGYDTNPARTPGGRASWFGTVAPELIARSDWERHEVTATLRGSYTAYSQTPELDRPAFDGKITGRLDVTRYTALIGEGTLVVGTDNPGSPNVQAGLSRFPVYTTLGGSAGVTQRFNRLEVTAKGTAERTEYQQSTFTDGTTQSNDDRNFDRFGGTARVSYDLMPGLKPFVEGAADTRKHDLAVDRFGLQRDSTGWQIKGGSSFEFTRRLTGEFGVGWIERSYKDPTLPELSGFLFDAALIYSMSALTNIKLTANTQAAESTVPGTAGVLTRNAGIEIDHAFRRWLIGTVKFNYGLDDYVGSTRKDDRYSVSAALTYKLNRWAQIRGEVREEWLRSTTPTGVDYNATVFMLGMRLQP